MHELSIARKLLNIVLSEVEKYGAKDVISVEVVIGELSFIRIEQFAFWFRVLSKGTALEKAKLHINVERGKVKCLSCGYEGPINVVDDPAWHVSFPSLSCPRCSSTVKIVSGRDCYVKRIRLVREQ